NVLRHQTNLSVPEPPKQPPQRRGLVGVGIHGRPASPLRPAPVPPPCGAHFKKRQKSHDPPGPNVPRILWALRLPSDRRGQARITGPPPAPRYYLVFLNALVKRWLTVPSPALHIPQIGLERLKSRSSNLIRRSAGPPETMVIVRPSQRAGLAYLLGSFAKDGFNTGVSCHRKNAEEEGIWTRTGQCSFGKTLDKPRNMESPE